MFTPGDSTSRACDFGLTHTHAYTLANKQTHSHTHSHTHMHTHSHTRSTSNTYYILTCHYFARIPLSEYDHEVSTVNQRKLNSRSLTLAQKTRMTQKASAEICTIVSGPNPTPSGQLYTIRRQADGELIPIVQSPDTPPLLRKRRVVPQVVVHQRGPVPCSVLQLLPLVAAAALKVGVDKCHEYHTKKLGNSFQNDSSRRGFARRVQRTMQVQYVTCKDVRLCLDVMFDQPGAVWEVCHWYADSTDIDTFNEGTLLILLFRLLTCMCVCHARLIHTLSHSAGDQAQENI